MQQNLTLKKLIFSLILVGFLLLSISNSLSQNFSRRGLFSANRVPPDISLGETNTPLPQLTQDIPTAVKKNSTISLSIKIPILGINAPVESVGLTTQGAVDIPQKFTNAAWYNLGTYPGKIGSAVIVGHFGVKNGQPGVFNSINTLKKGDKIYVQNGDKSNTFIVREFRTYRADETDKDIFYSSDVKAHLNLITCQGVWDSVSKSYPERFIVFTDISSEMSMPTSQELSE